MCSFLLPCQSSSDVRTYLSTTVYRDGHAVCPLVRVMHYSDTRPSAPALLPLDPKSSSRSPSFGTHPTEDWGVTDGAMLSREAAVVFTHLPPCLSPESGDGGGLDGKRLMRCDRVRVPGTI